MLNQIPFQQSFLYSFSTQLVSQAKAFQTTKFLFDLRI